MSRIRTNPVEATGDSQKPKNLIRSQYKDIMVKVDEDVYYLDRLQLALKSEYFEKLFIEDYADKNCELIEIPVMDTDTFSAIVDIMYGEKVESVVNSNNYVSLLMAMDYLQMEIDQETCQMVVMKYLFSSFDMNVFKLYQFITRNSNYDYLLWIIFQHMSENLENVKDLDEFLSIPIDHFLQIIIFGGNYQLKMKRMCGKICARWICYDLENRLPYSIRLVNAIKGRLRLPFDIDEENPSIPLPTMSKNLNQDTISRYFYTLLEYNGQVCNTKTDLPELNTEKCKKNVKSDSKNPRVSKSTRELKLQTFRRDEIFCDIVVKVGEKRYNLHRSVLKSASGYFEEIFSAEYTEILAKCEGIPVLPSIDKEYFLNEIDQSTFDLVIDYIYSKNVKFSADAIVRLFKAANLLRIDDLLEQCESWMMENSEDVCTPDVIEILNFTRENVKYEDLNKLYLSKYVVDSWPKIGKLPQFADLFEAITVAEAIPGCPGENEVYLFNNIDQGTFQLIINYIYHDNLDLNKYNITNVLKASEILKMKKLTLNCIKKLTIYPWEVDLDSDDVIEVLRFALRNDIYEDLIEVYLPKHIIQWPEIDNALFCSFSYEALETMLMSPDLHFDDPYKILDICSKWIIHDIENRYHLVAKIALAISCNGLVDCDDYATIAIEFPSDLKTCSQDFIKAKFLEILTRTSVIPFDESSNNEKKSRTDLPIFITSKTEKISFCILNSNLEEITTLNLCKYVEIFCPGLHPMSATMINDNLFLICSIFEESFLHVYNFSSKKSYSLALDSRFNPDPGCLEPPKKYTLLNCGGNIYCCFEDGKIFKYLFELNRWKLFWGSEPNKERLQFTSDGNSLYRMYKLSETQNTTNFVMETYSAAQNSWIFLPNVPVLSHTHGVRPGSFKDETYYQLTYLNNFGFFVLYDQGLYLFNQYAAWWQNMPLPFHFTTSKFGKRHSFITQNESGELLHLWYNKLYRFFPLIREWRLEKQLPFLEPEGSNVLPYGNIIVIHKPIINT